MNPEVLRWAREQLGLSVEEAASRIGKAASDLESWEVGDAYPTFRQLETLAEKVYKRPVAMFFLPEPPDEAPLTSAFRTLPELERDSLEPDTLLALREALAFQVSVRELSAGTNPAPRHIWKDLSQTTAQVDRLAARVREYLGISVERQSAWKSTREAMSQWRVSVEQAGLFVFKRSFKQRDVSGFSFDDPEFPIIVVNNGSAFSRQIFTLFHEMAHVLFDVSGVTRVNSSFVDRLAGEAGRIEVACNRFAAEFLMPEDSFPWSEFRGDVTDAAIAAVAGRFNVSREVVLRRLLDRGLVDEASYRAKVLEWFREYQNIDRGSGGDYYNTQAAYLGGAFLELAFSEYYAGSVSLPQLADHLGMKARNVGRLEETLLARR